MRSQFDPLPFARQTGLPVDEVEHVFSALVCNPLYSAKEATKRGEEGMFEMMEFYAKYGTQTRQWGKDEEGAKQIRGELHDVGPGLVEVILEDGAKDRLKLSELSRSDIKYLKETLTDEHKGVLWQSTHV